MGTVHTNTSHDSFKERRPITFTQPASHKKVDYHFINNEHVPPSPNLNHILLLSIDMSKLEFITHNSWILGLLYCTKYNRNPYNNNEISPVCIILNSVPCFVGNRSNHIYLNKMHRWIFSSFSIFFLYIYFNCHYGLFSQWPGNKC